VTNYLKNELKQWRFIPEEKNYFHKDNPFLLFNNKGISVLFNFTICCRLRFTKQAIFIPNKIWFERFIALIITRISFSKRVRLFSWYGSYLAKLLKNRTDCIRKVMTINDIRRHRLNITIFHVHCNAEFVGFVHRRLQLDLFVTANDHRAKKLVY